MRNNPLIKFFISLRLTVVLLAFSILLVFLGTLAQVDEGLFNAQALYFRSFLVGLTFHPLHFTGISIFGYHFPVILPGGYLLGFMLLINLVVSHIFRFQFTVRKLGIHLAHGGIILLLVGQLATDMFARESQIRFAEGQTRSYAESPSKYELVFTTAADAAHNREIIIPSSVLARGGTIQNAQLPFSIRVESYWKNSDPMFRAPMMQNGPPMTTNGIGAAFDFHQAAEARDMDSKNIPTARIQLQGPGGPLGDWIVSGWAGDEGMLQALEQSYAQQVGPQMAGTIARRLSTPQTVSIGGRQFAFTLRPQRIYMPFSLTLLKATHSNYPGTDIPKDFRSRVQLQNPQTGENREVQIFMNNPLRYDGLTFYQYQMDAGQMARQAGRAPTSVLQVVRNPSWLTPYIGCSLVALGLVIQFLFHLVGFVSKSKSKTAGRPAPTRQSAPAREEIQTV